MKKHNIESLKAKYPKLTKSTLKILLYIIDTHNSKLSFIKCNQTIMYATGIASSSTVSIALQSLEKYGIIRRIVGVTQIFVNNKIKIYPTNRTIILTKGTICFLKSRPIDTTAQYNKKTGKIMKLLTLNDIKQDNKHGLPDSFLEKYIELFKDKGKELEKYMWEGLQMKLDELVKGGVRAFEAFEYMLERGWTNINLSYFFHWFKDAIIKMGSAIKDAITERYSQWDNKKGQNTKKPEAQSAVNASPITIASREKREKPKNRVSVRDKLKESSSEYHMSLAQLAQN